MTLVKRRSAGLMTLVSDIGFLALASPSAGQSEPRASPATTRCLISSFLTSSNASVVIEAKITGDDGTARDKVVRIERLTRMRDDRISDGQPDFEVVACIDGRGFGVRREDMRSLITRTAASHSRWPHWSR